ncbi:hypothetical protein Bca4012_010919 [Brassica carinata]|uniref:Replication protein A 70 kDa DNA-binding subunit B/D first OB fold domain-containing protein n=1 Tax=Brassica carinata TaxID=52824 RepID=A0A8X7S3V2_BRACI|nr:hypothetical protein Bca52824_035819 [Brassica carinata]
MMTNAIHNPVKNLKPYKTKWRSQVKLLHSWQQTTSFGGETLQMGDKILATCKRNIMLSVQRKLPLGKWRVLTMFSVSQASGQYRPRGHPYKLTIGDETVITNSDLTQDSIFLDLARFEDIIDGSLNKHFLIDLIRKIVSLEPVQTVKGQDRKKVKFCLVDSNGKDLACCLLGKYAEQLEAYAECEQPLICLIRWAKITFCCNIIFGTFMFTCMTFTYRLLEDELPLSVIEKKNGKREMVLTEDDWNDLEIKMISELFVANLVENCKIICSIEDVDTDWTWFYFGHERCKHRAIKIGKIVPSRPNNDEKQVWHCGKCHINITEVIQASFDYEDDTETCKLLLLNTVATTIVGHEAVDLWDGSYDEVMYPELLPEPIKEIFGKSFCFGIAVCSDNVTNGADTFKVLEVWSGDKLLKVEEQSEPISMIGTSSSTTTSGDVLMLEGNSQNESDECKMRFSKRKEEDADLPDITSTSKKLCTSIKVEKEKEKDE